MKHEMPVITAEEKAELTEYLQGSKIFTRQVSDKLDRLMRAITLASLTADSIGIVGKNLHGAKGFIDDNKVDSVTDGTLLYGAPPVPVVPARPVVLKPVVIPRGYKQQVGYTIAGGSEPVAVMIPADDGDWLNRFDVERAIATSEGRFL